MKYSRLLSLLALAIAGLLPSPAAAQERVPVDYGFRPNGRENNDGLSMTSEDFNNIATNLKKGYPDGLYWDSHVQTPRTEPGDDCFYIQFKDVNGGDKVIIEIESTSDVNITSFHVSWNGSTSQSADGAKNVIKDDNGKCSLELNMPSDFKNDRYIGFFVRSNYTFTYTENEKEETGMAMRLKELTVSKIPASTDELTWINNLYISDYQNFSYVHTHGYVDKSGINSSDNYLPISDWNDDGTYNGERKLRVDFTYIGEGNHLDEKIGEQNYDPIAGTIVEGERQRTYTVVHEISAFPQERVDLYCFSDIHINDKHQYQEDFIRWYDYKTDKRSEYLYFFRDPNNVYITPFGHIGGTALNEQQFPITVASFVCPKDFSTKYPDGIYIAADFSRKFDRNKKERIKDNKIYEPTIMYRHVFHIVDAKTASEKINGNNGENNEKFVKKNRRILSARGGQTFTIRLDESMPDDGTNGMSNIVFSGKQGVFNYSDGTPNYGRVREYGILTYRYDNDTKGEDVTGMFEKYERSVYYTMTSTIKRENVKEFVDLDERFWKRDNQKFYRAIICKAEKTDRNKKEKFLVQIVAKNGEGKFITVDGNDVVDNISDENPPLIIQEYVIEFLPDTQASFLVEEEYNEAKHNTNSPFYTHTEDYLENIVGASKEEVNFDRYCDYPDNFFFKKDGTKRLLTLPYPFAESQYGTPYDDKGDWNIYKIFNHSDMAPFYESDATTKRTHRYYDRLYYNTNGAKQGFMCYVNAASDPGEILSIPIDKLCNGTTIYVSAWVNEYSPDHPETANIGFNFRAKVNEYDENNNFVGTAENAILHGFITGYVKRKTGVDDFTDTDVTCNKGIYDSGNQGKWMHVYYSFVPDLSVLNEYQQSDNKREDNSENGHYYKTEYELVLENNCISSLGADYVVDDVRMYLVPPRVEAHQARPICEISQDKKQDVNIKIEMPFSSLLKANGWEEGTDQTQVMQYAILNKALYDKYLENHSEDPERFNQAFAKAVLHYPHRHVYTGNIGNDEDKEIVAKKELSWGTIQFNTTFEKNNVFNDNLLDQPDEDQAKGLAKREGDYVKEGENIIGDDRRIVFISTPAITDIRKTPELLIVVANFESTGVFETEKNNALAYNAANPYEHDILLAQKFDLANCARKAPFKIEGPVQVIVDGYYQTDNDNIICCENQRPVVQVDLYAKNKDDNKLEVPDDKLTKTPYIDWYYGSYDEFASQTVDESAESMSLLEALGIFRKAYPTSDTWNEPDKGDYNSTIRNYLKLLIEAKKLYLYKSSFVFPQTGGTDSKEAHVIAIPLQTDGVTIDKQHYLCTAPTEVTVHLVNNSPSMLNGFNSSVEYPSYMEDVALRIGLDQLNSVSGIADFEEKPSGSNYFDTDGVILTMPLRNVTATKNGTQMNIKENDPYVYLAETNDPDYRALGNYSDAENSATNAPMFKAHGDITNLPGTLNAVDYDIAKSYYFKSDENVSKDNGTVIENIKANEKYVYNVNFTQNGTYKVTMHYRKGSYNNGDTKFSMQAGPKGKAVFCEVPMIGSGDPDSNDWNTESTISFELGVKSAGNCDLILTIIEEAFNPRQFDFVRIGDYVPEVEYNKDLGMFVVGELVDLKAEVTNQYPMAQIKFYKNKINFKEGYYYKFKFAFEEDYTGVSMPDEEPCNGETVFSVKVVPEYQKWTGAEGVNWNNDANWSRVTYDELKANSNTDTDLADHVTNDEAKKTSYAPLDFTKVIIPAGKVYPQLAEREHDRNGNTGISVVNGHNNNALKQFVWKADAPAATEILTGDNTEATADIQFDMASVEYANDKNVYCRPWYANAAAEVHFNSNAEIYAQQHLDYEKAWVDMEMTPARWYIASSPLQDVVAGDMYLPTAGARQETRLFEDITFSKGTNDRFRPAVYQRGWDKGTATVYELPGVTPHERGVAVTLDWSEVYNDVKESYFGGLGYSIKTDVSEATKVNNKEISLVKFRLPKADTSYEYWNYEGDKNNTENGGGIERDNAYRLNDVEKTVTLSNVSGQYYLAGNPFMAHIDMKTFLTANEGVIEPKFWVLEGYSYKAYSLGSDGIIATQGSSFADGVLPPMQGFFLAKKGVTGDLPVTRTEEEEKDKTLTITFTPAMMAVKAYDATTDGVLLKTAAHGDDVETAAAGLTITANGDESSALVMLSEKADRGYAAAEDAVMLSERERTAAQVYTVGGHRALSINATSDADGTEVGVMAGEDDVTVLRFANVDGFEHLSLLDSATGEHMPLEEGLEYVVTGDVTGRLFLTSSVDTPEVELVGLDIMVENGDVVAKAPNASTGVDLYVYDPAGLCVASAKGCQKEARISGLERGIYLVVATASDGTKCRKKLRL